MDLHARGGGRILSKRGFVGVVERLGNRPNQDQLVFEEGAALELRVGLQEAVDEDFLQGNVGVGGRRPLVVDELLVAVRALASHKLLIG